MPGEHISRVAYDDNEPPKNYIWAKPDGTYWKWNGVRWMLVRQFVEDCPHIPPIHQHCAPKPHNDKDCDCGCSNGYITKDQLNTRLDAFKADLFAQIVQYLEGSNGGVTDLETLREFFTEYIEPRIEALEQNESTYDATELINSINNVSSRVNVLESLPHSTYATKPELASAVHEINEDIDELNNRIDNIDIGDIDTSMFVTATEVNDPISIQL